MTDSPTENQTDPCQNSSAGGTANAPCLAASASCGGDAGARDGVDQSPEPGARPSKQMRTFSFDGEGIYEMPEGVGEYVLASEARAEIERLRAICAAAYQMAGAYDAPVRFLDALALHDEYLAMTPDQIIDALLPVESPDETTPSPQAPIARVIVSEDAPAQVLLYAPGLPIGEHDLYCEPTGRVKSISQELRERGFPRRDRLPNDDVPEKASGG